MNEKLLQYLWNFKIFNSFDFKDVIEACKDKVVYVGDFSFTKDELEELTKVTKSIIVIDHHLSAFESIGDLDYVHIDLEKSGARLAWEFFFPLTVKAPILIALIEDRDLCIMVSNLLSNAVEAIKKINKNCEKLISFNIKSGKPSGFPLFIFHPHLDIFHLFLVGYFL